MKNYTRIDIDVNMELSDNSDKGPIAMHVRFYGKTIITLIVVACLLFLSGCSGYTSPRIVKPEIELNTDRPGSDIQTIRLEMAKPHLCADACFSSDGCKAWTYVKPGILGPDAHCRLKSQVPTPKRSSCCISGVR
ncbi:MAG: hypothetical protein GY753_19735 [Gammaproteobacteria bacterium]|nr:hypothetical protein [Gammaproteobacteria bacterium]